MVFKIKFLALLKKNQKAMFFGEGDIRMDKVSRRKLYHFMLFKKTKGF